jgi:hypothetical protein
MASFRTTAFSPAVGGISREADVACPHRVPISLISIENFHQREGKQIETKIKPNPITEQVKESPEKEQRGSAKRNRAKKLRKKYREGHGFSRAEKGVLKGTGFSR